GSGVQAGATGMSLRVRLALSFALLAGLVAAAVGLVVYQLTQQDLLDRARAKAVSSARDAASFYNRYDVLSPGSVVGPGRGVPPQLRSVVGGRHVVATFKGPVQGHPYIWAGVPSARAPGGVYVRISFAADQATIADLRRTLIEVGLAGAAGGALLGAALAWRLSRRLRVAAAAAERVTAGSLSARVNARGSDEVAALGAAMDRMADSLQERIEHEQRFVANVAHDLRTPVTGLVAAASLLEPDQVGAVVRERVSRLHTLVEDLLEISRLENGAVTADLRWVDVDAFVRSLIERRPGVVADASEPARVFTDPRRLERIIDNLLDNSARHGGPPVVVAVRGRTIVVSDSGPGFAPDMLAHATERFATGDTARGHGIGLGLSIAAAQARVLGGALRVANRPEGGAEVTVELSDRAPTAEPAS
ncbi:MAG TPA: HAMP domain-containing sensor histidine kinase, partial [Gaiellales bacterium]|nr:HAMP domain-containing sensor histidine kinase [Gaiellales bacterium]